MPVENNPQTVEDLNPIWPLDTDQVKFGSAHLRNIKQAVRGSAFPVGTKMLFQQTNAPTGWVKDTTHNDKALRVVTGTVGSGGSNAFSTAFNSARTTSSNGAHSHSITVNNHTLNTDRMPSHQHTIKRGSTQATPNTGNFANGYPVPGTTLTGATGGSSAHNHGASSASAGAHTHTLNLNVQYVDLIIATKQ